MDPNTFPTKGNLILAKNSLALSRQGYELMDKKRNILIREMMNLVDQAKDIQGHPWKRRIRFNANAAVKPTSSCPSKEKNVQRIDTQNAL